MKLSNSVKEILRIAGIRSAGFLVNVLLTTVKVNIENGENVRRLVDGNQNFVFAFWHGSMVIGWYLNRKNNCSALVSRSRDGDVLAHVLKKWGYEVVRGSSHVGGNEALEMLLQLIRRNYSLAITPDGPTGPIHKMKAGAVVTAKKGNVPIVLAGIGCNRKIVFKSWDKFELPLPFSRVTAIYSDPIYFGEDMSYEETSLKIIECEELLNRLQKDAQEKCLI